MGSNSIINNAPTPPAGSVRKSTIMVTNVPAPPAGTLGRPEMYALSIGQVIGAGVITLVGPAIAFTGYSAWLGYLLAIVLGFFLILPVVFVTSTLRLGGGYYSALAALAGPKVAGAYAFAYLTQTVAIALFGAALGVYAQSVWPVLDPQIVGIVFLTVFYMINLFGVNIMAKAQKLMTWLLLAALVMFIAVGFFKLKNPIFNFSNPLFMTDGSKGLIAAMFLFVYSTQGYAMTMQYGRDAKNAKRDIPWAILMSVPTLIIVYCGVAIVGAGILPIDQIVNKPLTLVAKNILPSIFFVLFMIGGPIMALMTTINSTLAANCIPIAQSCKDGWLPKSFAAQNKYGAYWKILTFVYLMALIPLILKFNVTTITNNIMLLTSSLSFLYTYAYSQVPQKYPEAWKKSRFHIPDGLYYLICAISFVGFMAVFIKAAQNLTPMIVGISIGAMAICMVLGIIRSKSPNVHMETAVWDED